MNNEMGTKSKKRPCFMTWSAMFRMVLATLAKNMGENIQ